jgi:hypothetical protein
VLRLGPKVVIYRFQPTRSPSVLMIDSIMIMMMMMIMMIMIIMIIQFFIIYVPSQQLQGQLQTHHRVNTGNYIMDKHNIKSKINYRQALEEKHINTEK